MREEQAEKAVLLDELSEIENTDKQSLEIVETPQKRGRKEKPEAEKRTAKFSVYLTPSLFESLKDFAVISQQDISDIFFKFAADLVNRNADILQEYQEYKAKQKAKLR